VYLDFAKAFDTVPHERSFVKLASYGTQEQVLQWIRSFLRERRQRVGVAGSFSSWIDVLSGVPKVLFWGQFFMSATLMTCRSKWHHMYADDTKIFKSVNNELDSAALHDLDQLLK